MNTALLRVLAPLLLGVLAAASSCSAAAREDRASVLVFGGSGQLGSQIVSSLLNDGHEVSVFLRPTSSRERLAGLDATLIEGDVLDEAEVEAAMKSRRFDVVVNALGRSEQPMEFYATSGRLIAKWSRTTGVGQVILHSSVGVGDSRKAYPGEMPPFMVTLAREKGIAETALIDSGVPYTIIRNDTLRDLPADAPEHAKLYTDQNTLGVVSRRGLARLTAECVRNPTCMNRIFHAVDESMSK